MPFDFRVWTTSWVDGWTGYVVQIASIACGNHMRLPLSSFDSFSWGLATIRPRWNRTHFTNLWLLYTSLVYNQSILNFKFICKHTCWILARMSWGHILGVRAEKGAPAGGTKEPLIGLSLPLTVMSSQRRSSSSLPSSSPLASCSTR